MIKKINGFTLMEVMLVVIILSILAMIALPRLTASAGIAREKADIITGREVKTALDRYQIEKGIYPRVGDISAHNGTVIGAGFVPDYIKKLDSSTTQQVTELNRRGFGIAEIVSGGEYPQPQNLIMIYLTRDGSEAEVGVFNNTLTELLWSSY